MNVPVLWVISGCQELNVLAADPLVLGIPVPRDVAALAECFWGEDAVVLVTTREVASVHDCETLYGSVTEQEAALIEAALRAMVL